MRGQEVDEDGLEKFTGSQSVSLPNPPANQRNHSNEIQSRHQSQQDEQTRLSTKRVCSKKKSVAALARAGGRRKGLEERLCIHRVDECLLQPGRPASPEAVDEQSITQVRRADVIHQSDRGEFQSSQAAHVFYLNLECTCTAW